MRADPPRVLIVEDHQPTRRFLADNLAADGFEPAEASTAADARRRLADEGPGLLILDLGLPDRDGLELLADLRAGGRCGAADPAMPILVLSGRGSEIDRVRGFERGCDDYLVKPFSYAELRARIVVLLRRGTGRTRPGRLSVGDLEIDPTARAVWLAGAPVAVSKKEWELLEILASDPTRVFTREELLSRVWGFPGLMPTRTLDSHASRLRRKLSGGGRRYVVNVWGIGYRLSDMQA